MAVLHSNRQCRTAVLFNEIHYKIKGDQMQSVQAQRESLSKMTKLSNSGNNAFNESIYNDYIVTY